MEQPELLPGDLEDRTTETEPAEPEPPPAAETPAETTQRNSGNVG